MGDPGYDACAACKEDMSKPDDDEAKAIEREVMQLECGHHIHWPCIEQCVSAYGSAASCPLCRRPMKLKRGPGRLAELPTMVDLPPSLASAIMSGAQQRARMDQMRNLLVRALDVGPRRVRTREEREEDVPGLPRSVPRIEEMEDESSDEYDDDGNRLEQPVSPPPWWGGARTMIVRRDDGNVEH